VCQPRKIVGTASQEDGSSLFSVEWGYEGNPKAETEIRSSPPLKGQPARFSGFRASLVSAPNRS